MGSNAKTGSAAKIKMESFDDLFGGSAAQENGVDHGKAEVFQKRADEMFIKVLDLMVGPADIEKKPYHSIVFSGCGIVPFFIYPSGICIIFTQNECSGG